MRSAFAAACASFSLLAAYGQQAPDLLIVLGADPAPWQAAAAKAGWQIAAPKGEIALWSAQAVLGLEAALAKAKPGRTFLVGDPSAVFYMASRRPDLWTAAAAVGASVKAAIETNHLFAANTQALPMLWVGGAAEEVTRLRAAQWAFEPRTSATPEEVAEWLGKQRADPWPTQVDCETGSKLFARCYWLEMTQFDPARRNDVLQSTRVHPGAGARLALELKPGDKILAIAGKAAGTPQELEDLLEEIGGDKTVAVLVQRGKERLRLETRTVTAKRDEIVTARIQGQYNAEGREIVVISRAVSGARVRIPEGWAPVIVNWNGVEAGRARIAGCWELSGPAAKPELLPCR